MTKKELIKRYEHESGNYVSNDKVFDSMGNYICKFSITLAKNYHDIIVLTE